MIYIFSAIVLIGAAFGAYMLGQRIVRAQRAKEREEMRIALQRNIEQDDTPVASVDQPQAEEISAS